MKIMKKDLSKMKYTEAVAELESILKSMQGDECDIDRLTEMTRRATVLIAECRRRLTATDTELREILERLGSSETVGNDLP